LKKLLPKEQILKNTDKGIEMDSLKKQYYIYIKSLCLCPKMAKN